MQRSYTRSYRDHLVKVTLAIIGPKYRKVIGRVSGPPNLPALEKLASWFLCSRSQVQYLVPGPRADWSDDMGHTSDHLSGHIRADSTFEVVQIPPTTL